MSKTDFRPWRHKICFLKRDKVVVKLQPKNTCHSFIFNRFSTPDPRFSIGPILHPWSSNLAPAFPVNLEVLLIKIVLFFDHWSNQLFHGNQHFQATEFADRPVPEKLDMGFLFYGHKVLQVECVIVKYKATRINTSVIHTWRQTRSWSCFQ